jgi:hypothetical protein
MHNEDRMLLFLFFKANEDEDEKRESEGGKKGIKEAAMQT